MASDQLAPSVAADPHFLLYLRFYSESYRDERFEARIRTNYSNQKNRGIRKKAETMVSGYRSFDAVRQSVLQRFSDAAQKTPNCTLVPILKDIEQSMTCTFESVRAPFTCCVTGEPYPMGVSMTLTPDFDNPFGPKAKTYLMRSDFKKMLQAFRIVARFRYVVMKHVIESEPGPLTEDKDKCQEVYDKYLHAQRMLLYAIQNGPTI